MARCNDNQREVCKDHGYKWETLMMFDTIMRRLDRRIVLIVGLQTSIYVYNKLDYRTSLLLDGHGAIML